MRKVVLIVAAIALLGGGVFIGTKLTNDSRQTTSGTSSPQSTKTPDATSYAGKNLTKVGADIYSQTDITSLDLSNNKLTSLPSEIGKLTNLISLDVSYNELQGSLVAEIRKMTKLEQLDASHNKYTGIPAEIGQLSNLKVLDLSYNNIDTYPNELKNLRKLEKLDLRGNPLPNEKIREITAALINTEVLY